MPFLHPNPQVEGEEQNGEGINAQGSGTSDPWICSRKMSPYCVELWRLMGVIHQGKLAPNHCGGPMYSETPAEHQYKGSSLKNLLAMGNVLEGLETKWALSEGVKLGVWHFSSPPSPNWPAHVKASSETLHVPCWFSLSISCILAPPRMHGQDCCWWTSRGQHCSKQIPVQNLMSFKEHKESRDENTPFLVQK